MKILEDKDFLAFRGKQESQFITSLSESREEIQKRFEDGVSQFGDSLPWKKTHEMVRLRPGEVSLWGGVNGHGKSLMLSHVMAHVMKTQPTLIASMEMKVSATGHRMIRQIAGNEKPTREYISQIIDWTDNRLWIYDQLDTVQVDRIVGMCMYAMSELKIKHVVIDSLMKCGMGSDDYNAQKNFVDRLCWAAKTYDGHIHLVHHMRKGKSENDIPDKFDVKGAGEITDMVDNLFIVHRNKSKEQKIERGEAVDNLEPDSTLTVAKQRHGEWEGKIALYFDVSSHQYLSGPESKREWFDIQPRVIA